LISGQCECNDDCRQLYCAAVKKHVRQICSILAFVLVINASLDAKKEKWVVLPPSAAEAVSRLCSRSALPMVDGDWQPTAADISTMEKRLSKDSYLEEKLAHSAGPTSDPRHYYRQYVGVIVAGRKLIYINAFCEHSPPPYWQQRLVDDCDGGCNWGALYDPKAGEFSQFGTNGIA